MITCVMDLTPHQKRLFIAVSLGNLEVVKSLLENGVYPNGVNASGHTPLIIAITQDNQEMIDLLKEYGAKE